VARSLCDSGFQERDIAFDNGDSLQHLWSKIAVLMEQLEVWEAEQEFSSFMAGSVDEFKGLVERYQQLSRKAAWTFKLLGDPAPSSSSVLAAYMTYRWLLSIGNPGAQRPQFVLSVLPTTAMTGFVLGWIVPTWHRHASQWRRSTRGDDSEDRLLASPA
jgi:hypothetical protein